ncbi:MAG: AAA family ATPase [Nanoarchaeota archaeon]
MSGKIIGIISLKGGVGKTTTVSNLGAAMANEFKKKVLVIDANFSAPNLGLHLGMTDPEATIHDVLLDKIKAEEAIYEHEAGFHILPAAFMSRKINPFKLKHKIEHLKEYYDMILIDSSPNLNDEMLATMVASDELLVVSSPDYPTLSTTLRAIRLAKQKKTPISGLILNRVYNKKFELNIKDIEEAAGVPVLSIVPQDIRVPESVYYTNPVTLNRPKANSSIEFKKLAASLLCERYNDPRLLYRLKDLFKKDIPKEVINRTLLENER